uniref:BRCT domain-containing protein n=2 Tax=Physcomitrium patens TaxID=3218 RepID=A0A2K1JTG6_PHYPA|nr:hypothetical protein PHYPA_014604 [Physcomitrium patens]
MEDEGSGSSSFNSSDGGSGSWSPGLSHKTNQHVSNREGLHFLPLKSWLNGGYGGMKPKQLLSNDFYTRQFSRQRPEESDEDFEEGSDEERDEIGVNRELQRYACPNGEEDASESDYDGVYEETQLVEQYNAAHYSKFDHEVKLRCRGALDLPLSAGNFRQKLGCKQVNYAGETQLLENYDISHYGKADYEKSKPIHLPLNMAIHGVHTKDLEKFQRDTVDSDAETADEAEPTEVVDSEASTEDEATTSRQDQQEAPRLQKPNSEFRQERMCEFEMDLNVRLEEDMDCEYYGEPMNYDTQLVTNTETQLVDDYRDWQGDTQLVSTTGKEFLDNMSSRHSKVAAIDSKDMPCDKNDGFETKNRRAFTPVSSGGIQITKQTAENKTFSSSCMDLPSLTTESKLLVVPSVSEASESSSFQNCVGTVRAESIRIAAMQPLQWISKLKLDDYTFFNPQALKPSGNRIDARNCVDRAEVPSNEPEWMRDYGSKGDFLMSKFRDERISALGPRSGVSVQDSSLPKDSKLPGILTCEQEVMVEQGDVGRQTCFSGMRPLFGPDILNMNYKGTIGKLGYEGRGLVTPLQRRISSGPRLSSPTGSMNYLDSVEPGEEVKAEALDMVDKLVWLNSADAPQASPPRKYRKSFPGLPPASSTLANPALQVFEFEDTPVAQRSQSYNDVSLIKEIQAEWKKKTEQCHRALTIKKGKEKETGLLNEGERLSKLLTDDDREKINEPRLLLHAASTKRISAKLQQDKDEACLDATKTKSPATVKNLSTTHSPKTGRTPLLAKSPAVDSVTDEVKRLKGNSGEPGQVADNGLRNVVVDGMQKLSNLSTLSSNEVLEHSRVQEDREEKVLDGAQILTKRRSQGRNRREHIRVPEAVLLSRNYSSPEENSLLDCEMGKNSAAARKRRSLNIMLRDRSAKNARLTDEEDIEDQNELNDNADALSSPTSSGADPMFVLSEKPSSSRLKQRTPQVAEDSTDKDEETAVVEPERPQKRRRRRISEASKLLIGVEDIGHILGEDGVRTRSLRQLRGRCDDDNHAEPFSIALVQKRLRSARRGSGGGHEVPKTSTIDEMNEADNEVEQDASTGTWSASFQGDSDNDELEANDASSSGQQEEISDQGASHVDEPIEDDDASRMKVKRTRSIADVSSPSTLVLLPAPFPLVTGRRGRGAVVKPEIIEDGNLQCSDPSFVVPAAGKGPRMRTVRKRRDPQLLVLPSEDAWDSIQEGSASVSTEGSLRSRRVTKVSVLFSHGLLEDTVKKQRKIVEKLDGKITTKAADCTHFVAEKFVRSANMLEAMAGGKFVVTFAWLESCQLANCFIEERNFILQDERKERELNFSMRATILAAQYKPLLLGVRVLLTPSIIPKPPAIAAIIHAAGGQVVEEYEGPAPESQNEDYCIVLANENDRDICVPFLERGAKVYKSELILSGIISHHLEFSKHVLFENYRAGRRRGCALQQA